MLVKILKNSQGGSLVGSIVVMTAVAVAAMAVVNLSGIDLDAAAKDKHGKQAETIVIACLEASLNTVNKGGSPDATDVAFAQGLYTATSDASSGLITCTAKVGDTSRESSINTDFSKDVFALSLKEAYVDEASDESGNVVVHNAMKLVKNGHYQGILTKIHASWNISDCALNLNCDGAENVEEIIEESKETEEEIEYEDVGEAPSGKFWICHVPANDAEKANTLAVNMNGWLFGHSNGTENHSEDYLGPCELSDATDDTEETITDSTTTTETVVEVITCTADVIGISVLDQCEISDGGLKINQITLEDVVIFATGVTPLTTSASTSSGEETDVADTTMINDGTYYADITFTNDVPVGTWLTITAEFADGSELTGMVKLGNTPPSE